MKLLVFNLENGFIFIYDVLYVIWLDNIPSFYGDQKIALEKGALTVPTALPFTEDLLFDHSGGDRLRALLLFNSFLLII